jgi:delta-aminolevulinic acid dehydratase/porphobilinogen synthase
MIKRPRRLRRTAAIRNMVRETRLSVKDFIAPLFVKHGAGVKDAIPSMPGQYQFSVDTLAEEAETLWSLGVPSVILFGLPDAKDATGSRSWADDGIVQQAVSALKRRVPDMVVVTDVCLCEYTDHGHCGVIKDGEVDNDATLELLARQAVSHARAGADFVAPSDMMDGRIGAVRAALDGDHIPSSTRPLFTAPSGRLRTRRPSSATGPATRWTRPTPRRPCGRPNWTWKRAPISSWSNRPCLISTSSPGSGKSARCPWPPTT